MNNINLIGVGTGNLEHLTIAAINILNESDLILVPKKSEDTKDLINLRYEICSKFLKKENKNLVEFKVPERNKEKIYSESVNDWHEKLAMSWDKAIKNFKGKKNNISLLIWGDPCLYDSSIKISKILFSETNISIIPGITSIQVLLSEHKITLNNVGKSVQITTGRNLKSVGFQKYENRTIVLLDGECSFKYLKDKNYYIWWGAYLGMKKQILIKGKLNEVGLKIINERSKARNKYGWIMDVYLLEKL